ncbi:MAG: DNA-binding response regulator [Betaproteobacteria bacterium]|nr:MAG: DNA-binding response regulator [Betaproteobacteria bacterium]
MKLLLADDHEMVRVALKVALGPLAAQVAFVEARTAEEALAAAAAHPDLDLVLIDVNMPGMGGEEGVRRLRAAHPELPVLACSAAEDPALVRSLLALGVSGFIPKSDPTPVIQQAVRLVLAGGTYVPPRLLQGAPAAPEAPAPLASLTPRQQDVLRLLAEGKPNKLIARDLDISEATVKVHLLAVFRALGARNRTEAVVIAQRLLAGGEKGGAD